QRALDALKRAERPRIGRIARYPEAHVAPCGSGRQPFHFVRLPDEGTAAVGAAQQAALFQFAQHPAHGGPADLELLGQRPFGRKPLTAAVLAGANPLLDGSGNVADGRRPSQVVRFGTHLRLSMNHLYQNNGWLSRGWRLSAQRYG